LEPRDAVAALEALAGAEILLAGDPLEFAHPLVAAAIYEDLGAAQRAELHLRAARLLAADRIEPTRVGVHLLAAARHADPWVVATLRESASHALANGAGELAIEYLERALQEPPAGDERGTLLGELGRVEALLGRPDAHAHLSSAVDLSSGARERAGCLLELGRALALAGEHARAAGAFEQGAEALGETDCELARELQVALWMSAMLAGSPTGAAVPSVGEIAGRDGELSGGQRQLLAALAQQRAFEGSSPTELRALAARAWGAGELLRSEGSDGRAWTLVTGALMVADELELELEVCNAAVEDARLRGSPMAYATASYCRSWPLLHRGQIDDALADAQSALAAREDGWHTFTGAAVSVFALACLERGAHEDGRAALEPALADPVLRGSTEYLLLMWAHGRLLLAEGRTAQALEVLLQIGHLVGQAGLDLPALMPWRAYAGAAAHALGDRDRAASLAEQALASGQAAGIARVTAEALRLRARGLRGQEALACLEQARASIPAAPARLEHAYVLVEHGAALRRVQRRTEAREALQRGMLIAQAGGAKALAAHAAAELSAAGASRVTSAAGDGAEELTPSERRVAGLAAEGHSNREIAQHLFVTVKTVEYHLGNVFRKLGIKRRSQLALVLDRQLREIAAV
jgi:DNA-binding CsgD family transcriptional regulator